MTIELLPDERLDDLQCNGLKIIQNTKGFCFGMDAVLLVHFAEPNIRKGSRVLDMGTGTGVIPLLLSAYTEETELCGLEIQPDYVEMAGRSVALNGLSNRIHIHEGDIKVAGKLFPASSFHAVTCNPPYMMETHGLPNPHAAKNIARHEILCTLSDVVKNAATLLVPGGHFFMVHKPFRLVEIFDEMRTYGLEPKRMQMVHPYVDKEPNMVLVEGVRDGRPRLKIEPPMILG